MARTTTKPVATQAVAATPVKAAKPGAQPQGEPIHAAHVDADEFNGDFREFFSEMWADLGLPSGKRMLASLVLGMAAASGVAYVVSKVVAATMLGMFAMTGSLFLFWLVAALGIVLACWASMKAGTAVARWIASGRADEQAASAKARVVGWFSRKPAAPIKAAA